MIFIINLGGTAGISPVPYLLWDRIFLFPKRGIIYDKVNKTMASFHYSLIIKNNISINDSKI